MKRRVTKSDLFKYLEELRNEDRIKDDLNFEEFLTEHFADHTSILFLNEAGIAIIRGDNESLSNIVKAYVRNDFIYLWIYNSKPKNRILMDISNYAKNLSENKIRDYIHWYPRSVKEIIKEII